MNFKQFEKYSGLPSYINIYRDELHVSFRVSTNENSGKITTCLTMLLSLSYLILTSYYNLAITQPSHENNNNKILFKTLNVCTKNRKSTKFAVAKLDLLKVNLL